MVIVTQPAMATHHPYPMGRRRVLLAGCTGERDGLMDDDDVERAGGDGSRGYGDVNGLGNYPMTVCNSTAYNAGHEHPHRPYQGTSHLDAMASGRACGQRNLARTLPPFLAMGNVARA